MTTPDIEPKATNEPNVDHTYGADDEKKEQRKRVWLLLLLLLLLLICCCAGYFIIRYLLQPKPIPEMVPVVADVPYPPTYNFSFPADKPVGVAVSPDGEHVYVVESGGERLIKMFDRKGNLIKGFAPAGTTSSTRQPRYIAVEPSTGRVFVVERLNNAIQVFDADGNYLDAIIGPNVTLTKLLAGKFPNGIPTGTTFSYEGVNHILTYQAPGQPKQMEKLDLTKLFSVSWGPQGIRFDAEGNLIYTDVSPTEHSVRIIPAAALSSPLSAFAPEIAVFGSQGKDAGQFDFPQTAVRDRKGNFYVSDGNNYRVSAWTPELQYKQFFGFGATDGGLNLPRGMWMDSKDHLHVVDAVGSAVRVYDVSGDAPVYLFSFGTYGIAEGEMSYPVDICLDGFGKVYVTDSGNNRVEVWSY